MTLSSSFNWGCSSGSIIPKSQCRPVQPRDLEIETRYEGVPHPLIVDGNINYENLGKTSLDLLWLQKEMQKQGIGNLKDVLFASLDTEGQLYVQRKENPQEQ